MKHKIFYTMQLGVEPAIEAAMRWATTEGRTLAAFTWPSATCICVIANDPPDPNTRHPLAFLRARAPRDPIAQAYVKLLRSNSSIDEQTLITAALESYTTELDTVRKHAAEYLSKYMGPIVHIDTCIKCGRALSGDYERARNYIDGCSTCGRPR